MWYISVILAKTAEFSAGRLADSKESEVFQNVSIELHDFEETQIVDEIVVQMSGCIFFVDCEVAVTDWESKLDNAV